MSNSASVSALSEWDRPGNDQPLAKLTEKQCQILTEIESFMEGKRNFKEVRNCPIIKTLCKKILLTHLTPLNQLLPTTLLR